MYGYTVQVRADSEKGRRPTHTPVVLRTTLLDVAKELLTVRLEAGKIRELDKLAAGLERDRTYVVSQAIDAFLDVQRWQIEYTESALREADAGKLASPAEVKSAFARLRRKSKAR